MNHPQERPNARRVASDALRKIGRSQQRANHLMQLAGGKTTLEDQRTERRESMKKSRGKLLPQKSGSNFENPKSEAGKLLLHGSSSNLKKPKPEEAPQMSEEEWVRSFAVNRPKASRQIRITRR
jgi:hypothetical protein